MSALSFDHTMPCPLPAHLLYERLIAALSDTDAAPFWPSHLNRVQIPRMVAGQSFHATYRAPLGPDTRSPYILAALTPGEGFVYVPGSGHAFTGEVEVRVLRREDGSALRWSGEYHAPLWRPERAFFRLYFEPRFFGALGRSLASLT
jgi:hypothetical protein